MHALEADHHVFINLHTTKIYCLPDGYEVKDTYLNDIQYNLNPQFSKEQAKQVGQADFAMLPLRILAHCVPCVCVCACVCFAQLNTNTKFTHALDGTDYLPGVVGLNNTKKTDWLNVCVQSLLLVPPIRNYFLVEENYAKVWHQSLHTFVCVWHWSLRSPHVSTQCAEQVTLGEGIWGADL